jgi:tetratricopeptide (TPR) repeat protein
MDIGEAVRISNNVYSVWSANHAAETASREVIVSKDTEKMKDPATAEELRALHDILRADPQRYLQIVNGWIEQNPESSHAYFDRHSAWMKIGEPQRALVDLNKAIELRQQPTAMAFMARGEVYRHLGQHQKALEDFDRAETIDPADWQHGIVFGLLYQADSHARLGHEAAAMNCCARLPDDFWTPGLNGAPSGNKAEVTEKLRGIAAAMRSHSSLPR